MRFWVRDHRAKICVRIDTIRRLMGEQRGMGEWGDGLRSALAAQDREDRERAAAMSIEERLALGVKLSLFSAKLRGAFHDQTLAR